MLTEKEIVMDGLVGSAMFILFGGLMLVVAIVSKVYEIGYVGIGFLAIAIIINAYWYSRLNNGATEDTLNE